MSGQVNGREIRRQPHGPGYETLARHPTNPNLRVARVGSIVFLQSDDGAEPSRKLLTVHDVVERIAWLDDDALTRVLRAMGG